MKTHHLPGTSLSEQGLSPGEVQQRLEAETFHTPECLCVPEVAIQEREWVCRADTGQDTTPTTTTGAAANAQGGESILLQTNVG